MKEEGFENVYHLQGGILKYLETIDKKIAFGMANVLFLTKGFV